MGERRDDTRRRRRLPVRFWKRGEDKARSGFTTNISNGGMFIGANTVLSPGSRLRVEVLDPTHGFVIEGVVARAERSRPELRSVQSSGMGVRFLPTDELVRELFPQGESVQVDAMGTGSIPKITTPAPRAPAPSLELVHAGGGGAPSAEPEVERPRQLVREGKTQVRGFAVSFASAADLRSTYERDILQGGMFISTINPADVGDTIIVEVRPPATLSGPFRLRAKVVHRFDGGTDPGGGERNLLAGMGVEWLDPASARTSFEQCLQ